MNDNDQHQQELECVQSMFYESGDVIVRTDTTTNKSQGDSCPLIYTIRIPLPLTDHGLHHLSLECTCPATYPSSAHPQLYVRTPFSRHINDTINNHLITWLQQQHIGETCIIDAITWIQSDGLNIINEQVEKEKSKQIEPKMEKNREKSHAMREFIWFHHIYSKAKKKFIFDLTSQLGLHVVMKVGKPGIIVVEGDEEDVKQWISHVRGLSWQKMSSRLTQCPIATLLLPRGLTDMTELNDLLDHMRLYGLEEEMRSVCRWEEHEHDEGKKEQDANSDDENTAVTSKHQSKSTQTQPAKPTTQQQKNNNKSHPKTAAATTPATKPTASSTSRFESDSASSSSPIPSCIQPMTPTCIRLTISVKPNAASPSIVDRLVDTSLAHILSLLSTNDRCRIKRTSHRWHTVACTSCAWKHDTQLCLELPQQMLSIRDESGSTRVPLLRSLIGCHQLTITSTCSQSRPHINMTCLAPLSATLHHLSIDVGIHPELITQLSTISWHRLRTLRISLCKIHDTKRPCVNGVWQWNLAKSYVDALTTLLQTCTQSQLQAQLQAETQSQSQSQSQPRTFSFHLVTDWGHTALPLLLGESTITQFLTSLTITSSHTKHADLTDTECIQVWKTWMYAAAQVYKTKGRLQYIQIECYGIHERDRDALLEMMEMQPYYLPGVTLPHPQTWRQAPGAPVMPYTIHCVPRTTDVRTDIMSSSSPLLLRLATSTMCPCPMTDVLQLSVVDVLNLSNPVHVMEWDDCFGTSINNGHGLVAFQDMTRLELGEYGISNTEQDKTAVQHELYPKLCHALVESLPHLHHIVVKQSVATYLVPLLSAFFHYQLARARHQLTSLTVLRCDDMTPHMLFRCCRLLPSLTSLRVKLEEGFEAWIENHNENENEEKHDRIMMGHEQEHDNGSGSSSTQSQPHANHLKSPSTFPTIIGIPQMKRLIRELCPQLTAIKFW